MTVSRAHLCASSRVSLIPCSMVYSISRLRPSPAAAAVPPPAPSAVLPLLLLLAAAPDADLSRAAAGPAGACGSSCDDPDEVGCASTGGSHRW